MERAGAGRLNLARFSASAPSGLRFACADMSTDAVKPPRENLLLNLGCNLAAPALILSKLSDHLGARNALLLALVFPLGYGIADAFRRRQFNFLSALGFCSTLATGGLGLLKLQPFWFAIKEAAVPSLIGLAVLVSQWLGRPLVNTFLLNEQVINLPRLNTAIDEHQARPAYQRLLGRAAWLLAGSFLVSAVLNFALARYLITAQPDTPEFNAQLGRMTWMSWPVIVVPSTAMMMFALWRLLSGLQQLTGLKLEELMHTPPEKKPAPAPASSSKTGGKDL